MRRTLRGSRQALSYVSTLALVERLRKNSFMAAGLTCTCIRPGTLLHAGRPSATPIYFEGDVKMVNTQADARVQERQVDSAILNMHAPRIHRVSGFPDVPSADREVAMRLDNHGSRSPYVYHSGPRQS